STPARLTASQSTDQLKGEIAMVIRPLGRLAGFSCAVAVATLALAPNASADILLFSDSSGLSALAEFTLLNSTTLQVRLRNTSTGAPAGFTSAAQLLTGISWDFGALGANGSDPLITGGSVVIGPTSNSVNFDTGNYGPGADVSGEFRFGHRAHRGARCHAVS